ncbi:MAG: AmmeMemoRadiSam system radical SAM enzyme, partial [Acidobacteria bacterium]|nr:AmmeMemoRadiSam system radical SAM enzyme [Acidobacteriota bacterium]
MDVDARGSEVSSLPFPGAALTKYWHVTSDGRVQCDVCPRFCKLHEGQRGFCFVRACQGGQIVLTTYGRSSGFCVDPIEKKPLSHFLPGTPVLSFGTAGCNLGCRFCQNWDISKSRETATLAAEASPQAIVRAALATGSRSVAFTYNDPTVFHEYALDVARACREAGLKTVSVTAGYVCPEPRAELYLEIDAANVDLKAFTESFYEKITGSHLKNVL